MIGHYILDGAGRPIPESDILIWARWFEGADRHVAKTAIGGSWVSTVFLGLDHDFSGYGPPVLWETMVFGAPDGDDRQLRYRSLDEALDGHEEIVAEIRALVRPSLYQRLRRLLSGGKTKERS